MRLAGMIPEGFPDPRLALVEQAKLMPIPVMGFKPQPSLEDADLIGVISTQDGLECFDMTVSITYTLWRNPADRSDSANLANLDEETREEIEEVPLWPRPQWLVEHVERMRYPQLWEAVRTTWNSDPSVRNSVRALLVDHVNHILTNRYRQELWPGSNPWDEYLAVATERAVNEHVSAVIDGKVVPAAEIDTDPFVYGVGARLESGGVMTAVIPRDVLKYIQVQFKTRS